jgi:hypothetical protein
MLDTKQKVQAVIQLAALYGRPVLSTQKNPTVPVYEARIEGLVIDDNNTGHYIEDAAGGGCNREQAIANLFTLFTADRRVVLADSKSFYWHPTLNVWVSGYPENNNYVGILSDGA